MKNLARWIICGAAVAVAGARADASSTCSRHVHRRGTPIESPISDVSTHVLTEGSGAAAGAWRLPATGTGSASLQLFDETGRLSYLVRADLDRSGLVPPPGEPEQGGFHGVLILIEADGSFAEVGLVAGKWILPTDGAGSFGVDILVPRSEGREDRFVAVGTIEGVLRARRAGTGAEGSPGLKASPVNRAPGRIAATWELVP